MFLRLKLWAVGAGMALLALASIWFAGRKSAQADAKQEEMGNYVETRKRMDEVGRMSDADAAAEWLRARADRKR